MSVKHPETDADRAHKALHKIALQMKGVDSTQALIGKIEAMGETAVKLVAEHIDEVLAAADKPAEPTLPGVG